MTTQHHLRDFVTGLIAILVMIVCAKSLCGDDPSEDEPEDEPASRSGPPAQRPPVVSLAQRLVVASFMPGLTMSDFREAPFRGGTAVFIGDIATYFVKDSRVYAANGFAMTYSPGIPVADVTIGHSTIIEAIEAFERLDD